MTQQLELEEDVKETQLFERCSQPHCAELDDHHSSLRTIADIIKGALIGTLFGTLLAAIVILAIELYDFL